MDLTEFDWRPELWIACYDSDQQNGRLGRHIWEDNGLDVPENFFTDLKPFLCELTELLLFTHLVANPLST